MWAKSKDETGFAGPLTTTLVLVSGGLSSHKDGPFYFAGLLSFPWIFVYKGVKRILALGLFVVVVAAYVLMFGLKDAPGFAVTLVKTLVTTLLVVGFGFLGFEARQAAQQNKLLTRFMTLALVMVIIGLLLNVPFAFYFAGAISVSCIFAYKGVKQRLALGLLVVVVAAYLHTFGFKVY